MFAHAFDTLKIPDHRFGTRDTPKKVICLSVSQGPSLVMQFSNEFEHTKLMTSLIINLILAVFFRQSRSCEVIDKSHGDLNSSNSNYFPLCPPWWISIARLFLDSEVSTSIFCVLIWPRLSFHTVFFKSSLRPSYDPSWKLQCCALPGLFQSSNRFSKPPPRVLVSESGHSNR